MDPMNAVTKGNPVTYDNMGRSQRTQQSKPRKEKRAPCIRAAETRDRKYITLVWRRVVEKLGVEGWESITRIYCASTRGKRQGKRGSATAMQ